MINQTNSNTSGHNPESNGLSDLDLDETKKILDGCSAEERIDWAYKKFGPGFAITTSFGIQSAVLLNFIHEIQGEIKPKVIWVDTGYLPPETYSYAEKLNDLLNLNLVVAQSPISPARMEALYGRLWETNSVKDIEKYHLIRKINPLEETLNNLNIICWASGVRGNQTKHRQSMSSIEIIRGRLSLRPILEWTNKDIFYYMKEHNLPQHPLFEKGYSTVGDWHSSEPDGSKKHGRETRFGGLKEECGIHLNEINEEGL